MNMIEQLLEHTPLPRMVRARQSFHAPELPDAAEAVRQTIVRHDALAGLADGDRVAIAVGSRGIADLPAIVRETVRAVASAGGRPIIVPAMGSHGGATAEGQTEVLRRLGVTESAVEAPIVSSMDVVEIGKLPNGLPVYTDKAAYQADKVIVINRIKPHTSFRGPVESGLMKMMTIGLGKRKGAEAAHRYGYRQMPANVPDMARVVLARLPVLFGLAVIENAYDRPARILAVPADQIAQVEPELLKEAKALMPRILLNPLDVLIVDEMGKDISGNGMDPNITGRYATPYAHGGLEVSRMVALDLTEKTHGNALGLGLADITTKRAFDKIDWEQTYANAITSTVLGTVKVPMFLPSERLAVKAAIQTCNAPDLQRARVVRIRHTLDLENIRISESLIPDAEGIREIEIVSGPEPIRLS